MSQGQDAAVKNPTQYYASLTVALCSGAGHTITWKTMFSTGFYILNRIKKAGNRVERTVNRIKNLKIKLYKEWLEN